jgi:hypothetical protein
MNKFDLIGALSNYASSKGWVFLSGHQSIQNYEASTKEYVNGQLVLTADFNAAPLFTQGGKISQIVYNGVLALGIKLDDDGTPAVEDDEETPEDETAVYSDGTPANLDETFIQKYNKRLLILMNTLATNIAAFACANELDVTGADFRLETNKFDSNIDFVVGTITFVQ